MLHRALLRRKVITDTFNCKVKQQVSGLKSPHLISGSIAGTPINSSFCFACANETLLRALCFFLESLCLSLNRIARYSLSVKT